jgi:hypothetical protein
MRVAIDHEVAAPVSLVFSVFSDIPKLAERIEKVTKVEMLTEGPMEKGARWRETRVVMKKEATEEMWYSEFHTDRSYTVRGESMGSVFLTTFTFQGANGTTSVRVEMVATPQTVMAKLLSPLTLLTKGMMRKCLTGDIEALGLVAESGWDVSEVEVSTETT